MPKYLHMLTMVIALLGLSLMTATVVRADDPPGLKLYNTYCAACHGASGKNGFAPAIGSATYLGANTDAVIAQVTGEGLKGGMPAWSKSKGGTLTDDQINDIVAYLRSLAGGSSTASASTATPLSSTVQVYVQTKLAVKQSPDANGNTILTATLTEFDGFPVIGTKVEFARTTRFGNVSLGTAKTDSVGNATLTVGDIPAESEIAANFGGDKNWNPSQAKLTLAPVYVASTTRLNTSRIHLSVDEPLLPPEGSLITPNPPLVPATLFLLVVGGIWTVYAFVISQILGIKKAGVTPERSNRLSFKTK